MIYRSKSEKDTFNIAKEYASTLKKGDIVFLSGDLGAGKTAFVKGVASYFNIQGVVSPTYAYLNVYDNLIYHYDFYRISCYEDALMLGLTDYFGGDNICLIEWPENIKDGFIRDYKIVEIKKISAKEREIIL